MKSEIRRKAALILAIAAFAVLAGARFANRPDGVIAQTAAITPTPVPVAFDQAAALAKLREQIKGRETEPAEKVFKNMQMLKQMPAGRSAGCHGIRIRPLARDKLHSLPRAR